MAETLESIAAKIEALGARFDAVDQRFDAADQRFDVADKRAGGFERRFDTLERRLDETKSELRTYIEAVDAKVGLVLEKVDDLIKRDMRHTAARVRFDDTLENHELRLTALESRKPTTGDD